MLSAIAKNSDTQVARSAASVLSSASWPPMLRQDSRRAGPGRLRPRPPGKASSASAAVSSSSPAISQ